MFAKLVVIILTIGGTASILLLNRQQRIDTVHAISEVHGRLNRHERDLWSIQLQIATLCRPDELRLAMHRVHNHWVPIPAPPNSSPTADTQLASTERDAPASLDFGG